MRIYLRGELGSGKTTLIRGLLRSLGVLGGVKSPSYALVELYVVSRLNLYHFDFYRFKNRSEWLSSGFRDHFNADSLCIVEWPERAGNLIAVPDLEIQLEYQGGQGEAAKETRRATPVAHSPAGEAWLASVLSRWRSS
jgi:tRNA threonylcarbamoyladenosine biosynthesis protein TsaE